MLEKIIIYIAWVISSLFVFYITERTKEIKLQKNQLYRLSKKLKFSLYNLISLDSSCKQYLTLMNYNLKDLWSIWFPIYQFDSILDYIPYTLKSKKDFGLITNLEVIDEILFTLEDSLKNLAINEIKEDLLSQKVSLEESDERYKWEIKFIQSITSEIDTYIYKIIESIALLEIIIEQNHNFYQINSLQLDFSKKIIDEKIHQIYEKFLKMEKVSDI